MNMIIHEIAENIEKTLLAGGNISDFIQKTKKMLDEIGVEITAKALETVDKLVKENEERKRDWKVKNKKSEKSLATIFGEVKYKRTYYVNKQTDEYRYLSDESVGIKANDRMDILLESMLIEEAIETPYRKSSEKISKNVTLTGQTVMNAIRNLDTVSNQAEPRLVYVHEGKQKIGKDRYKLINPRYFSGVYKENADLWLEVADYIDEVYGNKNIEKIYLSGDGAR